MRLLSAPVSYDAAARRRTRRTAARLRPALLPLAVLGAAVVLAGAMAPSPEALPAPAGPVVPPGRVLVVLSPADPAVLAVALPGSLVDVYAAPPSGWGVTSDPPTGGGATGGASLLVSGALVVGLPPPADPTEGVSLVAAATGAATSVTLAVTDAQARTLAGAGTVPTGGAALSLAVRGPAVGRRGAPGSPGG